jgi:hypothetical protein
MPNVRSILGGVGACLAIGVGVPNAAHGLPTDFELLIEVSQQTDIFGLSLQPGDLFTGTFTADSDDFQGTGSANATLTDFSLAIGDSRFDYAELEVGIVFTDSILEAIQTGDEVDASSGPYPAHMAFVAATRFVGFAQFPPGPPIPNILRLNATYTITAVPDPITEFVAFSDPTDDHTGIIDLVRMEFRFSSGTGSYSVTYFASPDAPFVGRFQLSTALFNPDVDDSLFRAVSQEFNLATPTTAVRDEGRDPRLFFWGVGDRVAASGPDPFGVPTGTVEFASGVSEPVTLGVDRFSSAGGVVSLPEPTSVLLGASALVSLASLRMRRRRLNSCETARNSESSTPAQERLLAGL